MYPVYCSVFIYWFVANISADFGIRTVYTTLIACLPNGASLGPEMPGRVWFKTNLSGATKKNPFISSLCTIQQASYIPYALCGLNFRSFRGPRAIHEYF